MKEYINSTLTEALNAHAKGLVLVAQKKYEILLRLKPIHPIAANNLASILITQGNAEIALPMIEKLCQQHPSYVDAKANAASCYGHLQRWPDCLEASQQALQLNKENPNAWLWQARAQAALGNTRQATAALEKGLDSTKANPAWCLIEEHANSLVQQGNPSRAIKLLRSHYTTCSEKGKIISAIREIFAETGKINRFQSAISKASSSHKADINIRLQNAKEKIGTSNEKDAILELFSIVSSNPHIPSAWIELGKILKIQKNYPKAVACLERALQENPNINHGWRELIWCLVDARESKKAARTAAKARQRFPLDEDILHGYSIALIDSGKIDTAALISRHYARSLQSPALFNCAGLALSYQGKADLAVSEFKKGIKIKTDDASLWGNRGMAHSLIGERRAAIRCHRLAIRRNPNNAGSHVNLGMALLAAKNFQKGLKEYEWRLRGDAIALNATVKGKLITKGETPKKLLIVSEQGLGDTIHFCRYLSDLRSHLPNTKLIFACPDKLLPLLSESITAVDEIIGCSNKRLRSEGIAYLPLLSIPFFCDLDLAAHQTRFPYINIPTNIAHEARRIIRKNTSDAQVVIGINWKGNSQTERTNLRGRSTNLEAFSVLANALPSAAFVSLQKGEGSEELEQCSFRGRFIENQSAIDIDWSFTGASGFILACDYIVTTDTCIAHLSGALHQDTFLLLSKCPEWRWEHGSDVSAWYPSIRLARQRSLGDWSHPLASAAQAIQEMSETKIHGGQGSISIN